MAATTISRATLTDSVSAITGDIWNAALVGTAVYDKIDALMTASLRIERSSSGDIAFTVANASNTASSDAQLLAVVAGTSAGDAYATFTVTSGSSWSLGTDNSASDAFKIAASAALGTTDWISLTTAGHLMLGSTSTANTFGTVALTLAQGSNDDDVLAFKSTDVAHGITSFADTDTYGRVRKIGATNGGILMDGFSTGVAYGLLMRGFSSTTDATRSTAALGSVMIDGLLKSVATAGSVGADKNLLVLRDNGTTRQIFDSDGDSHQDVGTAWTNFDDRDDVLALTALSAAVSRPGDPVREMFGHLIGDHRTALESARIVTFNDGPGEDGRPFVNWSRLNMLTIGAVRQLGMKLADMQAELTAVRAKLPQGNG